MSDTPKKSLSAKTKGPSVFSPPSFFQDKMSISDAIKKDITSQGKDFRWINYHKYLKDGAIHQNGWVAYQMPEAIRKSDTSLSLIGSNPDGIIRRGDCILAVRPKEFGVQHRQWLQQLNDNQSGSKRAKAAAEELRNKAKESNVDVAINEGYDDEE